MTPGKAKYLNDTGAPISFSIGSRPGIAWTSYDSLPGEIVEGPSAPGYAEKFFGAGYTLVTPEVQGMLDELAASELPEVVPMPAELIEETPEVEAVEQAPVKEFANGRAKRRAKG